MKFIRVFIILFGMFFILNKNVNAEEKIHIITVTELSTDAIILESNGKFAMIDVGEDFDYPKGDDPRYPLNDTITTDRGSAIEDKVLAYIEKLGIKEFEFIILTHVHSDHIGNIDEVLTKVPAKKVYLKKYDDYRISDKRRLFDNQYVYDKAIEIINKLNIELIQDITEEDSNIILGNMNIKLYNYENEYEKNGKLRPHLDDNTNSILSLVTTHNKKIFFGGDLDNVDGREDRYAPIIGEVDLMKFNHHFYTEKNNSKNFIRTLKPKAMIKTANLDVDEDYVEWLNRYNIEIIDAGRKDVEALVFKIDEQGIHNITDSITKYGVLNENNKYVYRLWNGELAKKGWLKSNSKYYYINEDNSLHQGWLEYGYGWLYLKEDKTMASKESLEIDNEFYYFNKDGYMETLVYRDGYFYGRNGGRINDFYISKYVLVLFVVILLIPFILLAYKFKKYIKIKN